LLFKCADTPDWWVLSLIGKFGGGRACDVDPTSSNVPSAAEFADFAPEYQNNALSLDRDNPPTLAEKYLD